MFFILFFIFFIFIVFFLFFSSSLVLGSCENGLVRIQEGEIFKGRRGSVGWGAARRQLDLTFLR